MKRAEKGPPSWGLWIGAAATAAVCLLWSAGALHAVTRHGWDLHFRHLSDMSADDSIVMIDINDHALEWVAAWPWPRRLHAELIDVLCELGARTIVMDIAFTEHKPKRADPDSSGFIDDDAELAAAIARAGNVYVAMLFDPAGPRPDPGAQSFLARVEALLRGDFGLDLDEVTEALGKGANLSRSSEEIERAFVKAKRLVAQREARRFLDESLDFDPLRPDVIWTAFHHHIMPGVSERAGIDRVSPDRKELRKALLKALALRASARNAPPVTDALGDLIRKGVRVSPPIHEIARVARGVGLVSYEREAVEGTVRKVPPAVDIDGRVMCSLGLLAAVDLLDGDLASIRREGSDLVMQTSRGLRRIPLDEKGMAAINWHVPPAGGNWPRSFVHLPVSGLMEIADRRNAIEKNLRRLGIERAELVRIRHEDTPAEYADYAVLVRERNDLSRARRLARTRDGVEQIKIKIAELDSRVVEHDVEALEWLVFQWNLLEDATPESEAEAVRREHIASLVTKWIDGDLAGETASRNDDLARQAAAQVDPLRERIAGKICFVGYTATAVAEFVPSPVFSAMPGVMAHANIANMVIQDRFVQPARPWMNLLLIAGAGLAVTTLTRTRGPAFGAASLFGVNAVVIIAAGVAFRTAVIQTDWLVACMCVCVSWAGVTAYRRLVEQRGQRRFRWALEQYTSPAVAAQIARTMNLQRRPHGALAPEPTRVTCFFSDLAGFTPLSERLGAERTRDVLNRYLEGMSAVLQAEGAIVNKFIGDGVFAFFNAPIWSCPQHAEAACASALAAQRALAQINEDSAAEDDPVSLAMRIGLATGEVFVGDYGSAAKLDYTCIGDTVNVASRLESAGKMFGSAILVDGETRTGAGQRFLFRPMGRLELPGKATPVEVHELLCERNRSDAHMQEVVRCFEEAIRCFQARRFGDAARHLQRCAEETPDDRVVRWYLRAIERYQSTDLPEDWPGTITVPDRYPPAY